MWAPNPGSKFSVVHLDSHVVVVAKDAGLLTTPAHGEPCLSEQLQAWIDRESFGRHALAVVHRLDRDTSGLLVFARSPAAAAFLARQFARHSVEREYVAVVAGSLAADQGTLRDELDGKRAVTHYEVTARLSQATTIAVHLETGRRNQIRRHFATLGHPLLGERRFRPELAYNSAWPYGRLALHARVLGFDHPIGRQRLRFEAEIPHEIEAFRR